MHSSKARHTLTTSQISPSQLFIPMPTIDSITFEDLKKGHTQPEAGVPDDPPPAYTPSASPGTSFPSGSTRPYAPPPPPALGARDPNYPAGARPTNFVSASPMPGRSLSNSYVIDPTLPCNLLADQLAQGRGESLSLQTISGKIDADVWLVPGQRGQQQRALLSARSVSGNVAVRVRCTNLNTSPHPFSLKVGTVSGRATVYLPRTFRGSLNLRAPNGSITLTPSLAAAASSNSETLFTRSCFVGTYNSAGKGMTDEALVETISGSVIVGYADEGGFIATAQPASGNVGGLAGLEGGAGLGGLVGLEGLVGLGGLAGLVNTAVWMSQSQ